MYNNQMFSVQDEEDTNIANSSVLAMGKIKTFSVHRLQDGAARSLIEYLVRSATG